MRKMLSCERCFLKSASTLHPSPATRQTFFHDIRALTRYLFFTGWELMLDFMITQLELVPYLDSS